MGEERWVGESADDFPWCLDLNRRRWRRDGSWTYLLVTFFFLFFFCNHELFVSRYKKPYAALAMKRKKPINAIPPPASPLHGKKSNTPSA